MRLRPFFSFYGSKWRNVSKRYPRPFHRTIVEPFAGSAGYSLHYPSNRVILYEIDPIIASVWTYLVRVKSSEILSIPNLDLDGTVDDLHVCEEAKWLVGLWLCRASRGPRKSPSKWMRDGNRPGSFWGDHIRTRIAYQLEKIRHWEVHNCSYSCGPEVGVATWFIDPPYQSTGRYYRFGSDSIDYSALADWCESRRGQTIVCEAEGADWLPFRRLARFRTARVGRYSNEVYWLNSFKRRDLRRVKVSKKKKSEGTSSKRPLTLHDLVGKRVTVYPAIKGIKKGKFRLRHVDLSAGVLTLSSKSRVLVLPIDKAALELSKSQ